MRCFLFLLKAKIVNFGRSLFSLLHGGESCIICGKSTLLIPLCKNCKNHFYSLKKIYEINRCCYCGKELISTINICSTCREEKILKSLDKVLPLFSYRLWNKTLVFEWKMKNVRCLSFFFADLLSKVLIKEKIDFIVPIPPREGKIKENGWDQIDELTKILHYRYKIPILYILKRNSNIQQKKLDRSERLNTIGAAYSVLRMEEILKKNKLKLSENDFLNSYKKQKICLIDDVCTTGATIEACGKLLKNFGFEYVEAVTLFTVD